MRSTGIAVVCALLAAQAGASRRAAVDEAAGAEWSLKPLLVGALARPRSGADLASSFPAPPQEQALEYGAGVVQRRIRRRDRLAELAGRIVKPGVSLVSEGGWRLVAKDLVSLGQRGGVWAASILAPDGAETDVAVTVEPAEERVRAMREVAIMEHLSGGSFVNFYGWTQNSDSVLVVSEPARTTLRSAVLDQTFQTVDVARRVSLATDLLEGLQHMASEGIVHRGISPESLMVVESEPRQRLKIADLSSACSAPDGPEEFRVSAEEEEGIEIGSLAHRAKEAWGGEWTPKGDVYSAGLVLYQMLFEGYLPSASTYDVDTDELLRAAERAAAWSLDIWLSRVLGVMREMLASDPAQRITAKEAYASLRQIASLPMRPRNAQRILRQVKRRAERS